MSMTHRARPPLDIVEPFELEKERPVQTPPPPSSLRQLVEWRGRAAVRHSLGPPLSLQRKKRP